MMAETQQKISTANPLDSREYQQLVYSYNQTDYDYPKDQTILSLFADSVKKNPNNPAVVFKNQYLTYQELNSRANQLAWYLRKKFNEKNKKDLESDALIAICLNRSIEMFIAILGILKAGAAYVPIDPLSPNERILHLVNDIGTSFVVTTTQVSSRLEKILEAQRHADDIAKLSQLIILDDDLTRNAIEQQPKSNLDLAIQPTSLAYVIYTSGTTGNPKGVMIEHRNVVNYLHDTKFRILKHSKKICFCTNIAFDLSVTTTLAALTSGKCVYVYDGAIQDIEALFNYINSQQIDTLKLVSSYAELLLREHKVKALKTLIVGGEKLTKSQIHIFRRAKVKYLFDEYGPTETTVGVTVADVFAAANQGIGKPISNSKIYILDSQLNPVATGIAGELYIGGAGVARGYLNQPALTQQKFINNPFATELDKSKGYIKLYKTGDLARWLPDGNIEYLGRNDFQVKINGYRIELEEIENALLKIRGIRQASVQVKEKVIGGLTSKYLVAYYVKAVNAEINKQEIVHRLPQLLPNYMLPAALVELNCLPLTNNGKLDRQALPNPEFALANNYSVPTNRLERQMCKIWKMVLGIKAVGITTNFFSAGGNSILSTLLLVKMKQAGFNFSIKDIFEQKTIANLLKLYQRQSSLLRLKKIKKQIKRIAKRCLAKINNRDVVYRPNDFHDYESYVVFNAQASSAPLFMFPPAGGGAETYFNNLVTELSGKYLVVFNNFYRYLLDALGETAVKTYSFEKLAAEYILLMKQIQPRGAYNLFGWSFGGVLAFEVARQLCLYGDKIDKLTIVNSAFDRKNVLQKLNNFNSVITPEGELNYRYNQKNVIFNDSAKVILYKATKAATTTEYRAHRSGKVTEYEAQQFALINEYYTSNTKDNYLHNVLQHQQVQIIPIETTHFAWISNAAIIKTIAAKLRSAE